MKDRHKGRYWAVRSAHFILTAAILLGSLTGCASMAWKNATTTNTIPAYEQFLNQHPEGQFKKDAEQRLEALYFSNAKSAETPVAYEEFLKRYPQSQFRKETEQKLEALYFSKAKSAETLDAYEEFLKRYPQSQFRKEAEQNTSTIRKEREIIAKAMEEQILNWAIVAKLLNAQSISTSLTFRDSSDKEIKFFDPGFAQFGTVFGARMRFHVDGRTLSIPCEAIYKNWTGQPDSIVAQYSADNQHQKTPIAITHKGSMCSLVLDESDEERTLVFGFLFQHGASNGAISFVLRQMKVNEKNREEFMLLSTTGILLDYLDANGKANHEYDCAVALLQKYSPFGGYRPIIGATQTDVTK